MIPRPATNFKDVDFSEQLQQLKMLLYQETLSSRDEVDGSTEVRHQRRHRRSKNKTATDSEQQAGTRSKLNYHYLAG
jgi:hypothetical protein